MQASGNKKIRLVAGIIVALSLLSWLAWRFGTGSMPGEVLELPPPSRLDEADRRTKLQSLESKTPCPTFDASSLVGEDPRVLALGTGKILWLETTGMGPEPTAWELGWYRICGKLVATLSARQGSRVLDAVDLGPSDPSAGEAVWTTRSQARCVPTSTLTAASSQLPPSPEGLVASGTGQLPAWKPGADGLVPARAWKADVQAHRFAATAAGEWRCFAAP